MAQAERADGVLEEDALRADLYALLSALLAKPPDRAMIERVAALGGDETVLGDGIGALARVARVTTEKALDREFHHLFIGLGRGELLPYGSYYMTGFLHEKPLALLRADMARLMITRAPDVYEPEDGMASLCEMMAGLIRGSFGTPAPLATQKDFFFAHLAPWAGPFFDDLAKAQNSVFYAPVGQIGRAFMDIEKEAFRMSG
ncbi:MAG: molecular chaperone TorD family protein [Pseudomonadota bacterium]